MGEKKFNKFLHNLRKLPATTLDNARQPWPEEKQQQQRVAQNQSAAGRGEEGRAQKKRSELRWVETMWKVECLTSWNTLKHAETCWKCAREKKTKTKTTPKPKPTTMASTLLENVEMSWESLTKCGKLLLQGCPLVLLLQGYPAIVIVAAAAAVCWIR